MYSPDVPVRRRQFVESRRPDGLPGLHYTLRSLYFTKPLHFSRARSLLESNRDARYLLTAFAMTREEL